MLVKRKGRPVRHFEPLRLSHIEQTEEWCARARFPKQTAVSRFGLLRLPILGKRKGAHEGQNCETDGRITLWASQALRYCANGMEAHESQNSDADDRITLWASQVLAYWAN